MKRICFLTDSIFSFGGVQRVTAVIAKELAKEYDVTIVTFDKPSDMDTSLYGLEEADIHYRFFRYPDTPGWKNFCCKSYSYLYRKLLPQTLCTSNLYAKSSFPSEKREALEDELLQGHYDVIIGDNTVIFPQVYVGKRTQIGQDCILYPQVVVREDCVLKNRVILQPGAKIGNDGFGFIFHEGQHHKIPQIGNVILEDDVEIQANSCVDRAKLAHTVVGANTKVDNLVQIAHNVKVGRSTILCSQVGIAGTTTVGNGVIAAGQVGIAGHLDIGDGAILGAQSGVMNNIPAGQSSLGSPARPMKETLRIMAVESKLPELYKELRTIKKVFEK